MISHRCENTMMKVSGLIAAVLMVPEVSSYQHISRKDLLNGSVEICSAEEQPGALLPKHLRPGDLATVVARDSGHRVDPETMFVGLPPKLTELFLRYINEHGMMDIFRSLLYEKQVQPGENRVFKLDDGSSWAASRPANWAHEGTMSNHLIMSPDELKFSQFVFAGDMTWVDPADELYVKQGHAVLWIEVL